MTKAPKKFSPACKARKPLSAPHQWEFCWFFCSQCSLPRQTSLGEPWWSASTLDTVGQGVGGLKGLKTLLVKMKILRLCWSSAAACRPRSRWSALECRSCRAAAVPSCFCPASCSGFNTTNGFPRPFPTHHIWLDCLSSYQTLTINNLILVRCLC